MENKVIHTGNVIADHVLNTYKQMLINRQQIAYEGHVFVVTDYWKIADGRIAYDVFDNMSMRHYTVYSE